MKVLVKVGLEVLCVLGFCKSAMDWDLGVGHGLRRSETNREIQTPSRGNCVQQNVVCHHLKDHEGKQSRALKRDKKNIFISRNTIFFVVLAQITGADFCSRQWIGIAKVRLANSM